MTGTVVVQCRKMGKELRRMKNIEMNAEGNILTIKIDLSQRFGKSSSGKSTIVASTEGNQSVPGHEEIKIGLNVYTK